MSGPYAEAAWLYRAAGWAGVLPLPPGAKWPPPGGYTGWAGVDPSGADVQAWVDGPQGGGNIAVRLPSGVYGLDVDDYAGKSGGAALGALVERLGPLPATWIVSSREESVSGIRLFRASLPPGRRWRNEPAGHGAGIESIHRGHRYAVVAPSVHPDTGRKYAWRRPDGAAAGDGELPAVDGLPELPAAWIEGLSEPGEVRTGDMAGHDEAVVAVTGWRDVGPSGEPCPRVTAAHHRALGGLSAAAAGAALHPAAVAALHELCNLGHEGHAGVRRVLAEHYAAFTDVRAARGGGGTGDRAGARADAELEWWRMVRGAVGKLPGAGVARCDCDVWSGALVTVDADEFAPDRLRTATVGAPLTATVGPALDGDAANGPDVIEPSNEEVWAEGVRREVLRLRLRDEAAEIHRGELFAQRWRPPVSYGTLADELRLPDDEPEWRIHGLLGNGHNAILVAGRKTGKTTLVNEFVRAYVDGGVFLGTQPVVPTGAGIAVFNYEVGERQYRRWLRAIGIYNLDRVHVLHLRGRSLALANDRVRAWVTEWLRDRGVTGWVLDPYSRAYVGSLDNGNDEAKVSAFLDTLDVIKEDAGIRELVMPVHTPKGRVESGEESAIGSQRLEGWPDVLWYLTRDGAARYLRAEGRDVEFDESELRYDRSSRRLEMEMFGQDRRTARLAAGLTKLTAYVHANPECTQNMIMAALGWNARTVREVVAASDGRIVIQPGPNRSMIHILKEDISGVTQIQSHTASDRVTPGLVGGVTLPVGESPPPPVSVTDPSHVTPTTTAETFNPFDLEGTTP